MMHRSTLLALALSVALLTAGGAQGVGALAETGSPSPQAITQSSGGGENVSVGVGQQLSTVISTTGVTTASSISEDLFEQRFANASEEERAELIVRRAATISDDADALESEFQNATQAYRNGTISTSSYAQRLATFNVRAETLVESATDLQERTSNVSDLELSAAGYNDTDLESAIETVDSLTGTGLATIHERFTGDGDADLSLELDEGLSVAAEEDGSFAREYEQEGDDNTTLLVNQSVALETARETLQSVENASWKLEDSDIDTEDGTYEFEFNLKTTNVTGDAEVTIDGSSGAVVSLEEAIEYEPFSEDEDDESDEGEDERDEDAEDEDESDDGNEDDETDDEEEDDADEEDDEVDDDEEEADEDVDVELVLTSGNVTPGGTVTVRALQEGEPVENLTVMVNDTLVGQTDANGKLSLTLPDRSTEIEAGDAELSIEFDDSEHEERELYRQLQVNGTATNGSVSVSVTYDGTGVENASVWVNDEMVGQTDSSGALSFDVGNQSELEVEIVKGAFEAELEFEQQNGTLTLTEVAHEGDGDKAESHDDDEDEEDEEDEEDADEESDGDDGDDDEESTETDEETDDDGADDGDETDSTSDDSTTDGVEEETADDGDGETSDGDSDGEDDEEEDGDDESDEDDG